MFALITSLVALLYLLETTEELYELYADFWKEAVNDLQQQHDQAKNYKHICISNKNHETIFYVWRYIWKTYNHDYSHPNYYTCVVPDFDRTIIVSISEQQGLESVNVSIMKCTCGYYQCETKSCRHMYSIFRRGPSNNDLYHKYLKCYEAFYGEK